MVRNSSRGLWTTGLHAWRGAGLQSAGKPIDNCYVESFNGRFQEECLNTHWFLSIEDARAKIEAWQLDYNAS